ncbi:MAG: hypothetical protein OXE85_09815 [Roseovarius sp.]|nr:hypothetical protein [Roseovarius sp.]
MQIQVVIGWVVPSAVRQRVGGHGAASVFGERLDRHLHGTGSCTAKEALVISDGHIGARL